MESHESFGRQLPKYAVDKLDSQRMNGMSFDAFFQDLNRITLQSAARYSMSKQISHSLTYSYDFTS